MTLRGPAARFVLAVALSLGAAAGFALFDGTSAGRPWRDGGRSYAAISEAEVGLAEEGLRAGFVAIVGSPNVGKSTLTNALVGQALCIATRKPQTTRHRILGIVNGPDYQIVLSDTPGVIDAPAYALQKGMMVAAKQACRDSEIVLLLTDIYESPDALEAIAEWLERQLPREGASATTTTTTRDAQTITSSDEEDTPITTMIDEDDEADNDEEEVDDDDNDNNDEYDDDDEEAAATLDDDEDEEVEDVTLIVGLNKVDELDAEGASSVEERLGALRRLFPRAAAVVPLSAREGEGVAALVATLASHLPLSAQRLFPDEDAVSDRSERFFAAELVREALLENYRKEIPYSCEVKIERFKEPFNNKGAKTKAVLRIAAVVHVQRDSQKGILIGAQGKAIKKLGIKAREKLEAFFGHQVHLDLRVKVAKDWRDDDAQLRTFGYPV